MARKKTIMKHDILNAAFKLACAMGFIISQRVRLRMS